MFPGFDLRAINPSVPLIDVLAGVWLMLTTAAIAHVLILPKLGAGRARNAALPAVVTAAGALAILATLAVAPRQLHVACLLYVAVFALAADRASREADPRKVSRKRIALCTAAMAASVAIAWFLASAPR